MVQIFSLSRPSKNPINSMKPLEFFCLFVLLSVTRIVLKVQGNLMEEHEISIRLNTCPFSSILSFIRGGGGGRTVCSQKKKVAQVFFPQSSLDLLCLEGKEENDRVGRQWVVKGLSRPHAFAISPLSNGPSPWHQIVTRVHGGRKRSMN